MTDGLPVLFSTSGGATYLFDGFGVWFKRKNTLLADDLPDWDDEDTASRVWYIIDPMPSTSAETMGVSSVFTVFATSPQVARYKDWCKQNPVDSAVADPWPADELHVL